MNVIADTKPKLFNIIRFRAVRLESVFEKACAQIVTHIMRKAFFKHTLSQEAI